jgi:hypothetical protein
MGEEFTEDVNDDGTVDVLDCKGEPGPTANVDALQAQVDALQAQVDALGAIHSKIVFVSSASYTGNLGGVAGADAKCQTLATAAGFSGTFKAWISDINGNTPAASFTHYPLPYLRVDGVKVADNWADLTDGSLDAAISVDEYGATYNGRVWTATTAAGELQVPWGPDHTNYGNCYNWTSASGNIPPGALYGQSTSTDSLWAVDWMYYCIIQYPLYCFEQ